MIGGCGAGGGAAANTLIMELLRARERAATPGTP